MEKKARQTWTAEARARHKAGCARYQELRRESKFTQDWCDFAREIDVDVKSLCKAILADRGKFLELAAIEPREERLKSIRGLVFNICLDAGSYRSSFDKMLVATA